MPPLDYNAIIEKSDAEKRSRAEQMPTVSHALRQLNQAYFRLKELGFNDAIYCPKDGTKFEAIEAGSAAIHAECWYQGSWPDGGWNVWSDNDVWPSRPILFRLKETGQQSEPCQAGN